MCLFAAKRGRQTVLLVCLVLLLTLFCLVVASPSVAHAQGNTGADPNNGNGTGNGTGTNPQTPMPGQNIDPNSFDPQTWLTSKTSYLVALVWAVFTTLMVLFILLHSGRMAAGGQQAAIEAKGNIIRVLASIALGAGGWFITTLIIKMI